VDFDVIVLGAGAAGMMCVAVAGGRGRRVLLLEHAAKLGEKIRISGGGRCNFTNLKQTMEARAVPGLYFIGEVVDVTGWLGG
jgi:predicted flavoprotein YhiN